MKNKWTITKLIATGSLGVLCLIIFLPYIIIRQILNVSGLFVLIGAFLIPSILIPGLFIIDTFGAATIGVSIFMMLVLPLPFGGPPGFFPKLILGPTVGIIIDFLYQALKGNRKLVAFSIGIGTILIQELAFIILLWFFSIPGWEVLLRLSLSPLGVIFILFHGTLGTIIGLQIWKKIKNTAVVRKIQGE